MGFRVLGFRVKGLGFGVQGLGDLEGHGDLEIMERKMETTIYYLGFRVMGT